MSQPTREIRHLIGGEWVGEPSYERRNPADTSELVFVAADGGAKQVNDAILAAEAAQARWAATPPPARGTVLADASALLAVRAEEVARDLTREEGKTLAEARGEVRRAIDVLRYFGGEGWRLGGQTLPSATPDTMVYTRREPLGVCGLITPWNFPIAIPAWKAAPALAAGNAVVLKPAELTATSAWHLARALTDAGLPPGVLNVVFGSGRAVGEPLVADHRVAAISFTGSVEVGRRIHAVVSERLGRVQLEMGGKNPLIVLDDADPAKAAQVAALSGFGLTGQACTATSRLITTRGIAARLVEELTAAAAGYAPGNGLADGVRMGPVVSDEQARADREFLDVATSEGAEVVAGGPGDERFFRPTVLTGVRREHRIAREEVFGPVIAVLEVDDLDEAIEVANDVEYGLAAGICTRDLASAQIFAERIQAGVVKVNRPTTGLDLNVPFGGVKASSTNTFREQGAVATEFYSWSKTVYLGHDPA